ncbi:MAG: class I SAM-dependent methyltransferase [Candidatus Acinetobacter avistercoris]|nr:class I SAM-dependent methyltransferase [Candidatus Acinetobacter avistercoris]
METLEKKINDLSAHYNELGRKHGYSPSATQQSSIETQEKRLNVLLGMISNLNGKKILDFGCGTGHLLSLLKNNGFNGSYVGYDISTELLKLASQRYPEGRFELKNILEQPVDESFDWIIISGVFNNDLGCNELFMKQVITKLFTHAKEGIVFNALSCYVDYQSPGLYYFDPCWVFNFCKGEITTHVQLKHDYEVKPGVIPFEFSCLLKKTTHKIVKKHE